MAALAMHARARGATTMTRSSALERVHKKAEARLSLVDPCLGDLSRTARRKSTTDRPLNMQTKSTIHTDSLVPTVFAEPIADHHATADAHFRLAPAMETVTTEPGPLAEVLAEQTRRALEDAWAADWGWPWLKAIWRAAAAEWRAARAQ